MIIRSMTAGFGKLARDTLTLEPGLNVIHAPNEWGKSTWCAFLAAMLYGIDTSRRDKKDTPAEKNRYAPWSGIPMSGRLEFMHDGQELTLERSSPARIPLGSARLWETESGVPITQPDAAELGTTLIGVERSVYERTGFIRLTDLPVTVDEALQKRLIALVTTGDESGSSQALSRELTKLKNSISRKPGGLLPAARKDLQKAQADLRELEKLTEGREGLLSELEERQLEADALENHRAWLVYAESQEAGEHLSQAQQELEQAQSRCAELEERCAALPDEAVLHVRRDELYELKEDMQSLQRQWHQVPLPPPRPKAPEIFAGLDPRHAREQVREDTVKLLSVTGGSWKLFVIVGLLLAAAGGFLWRFWGFAMGFIVITAGLALALPAVVRQLMLRREAEAIYEKYDSRDPADWAAEADSWAALEAEYTGAVNAFRKGRAAAEARSAELKKRLMELCPDGDAAGELKRIEEALDLLEELQDAREAAERAGHHRDTLAELVRPPVRPEIADCLTFDAEETERRLKDALSMAASLKESIGQYSGRMEKLESAEALRSRIAALEARVARLEQTLAAVELSIRIQQDAEDELRRRFAPRIAVRARELSAKLTGGRYDQLVLNDDLTLLAGSGQETLRELNRLSDGTADQLYLALRLAVADALIPGAPLILDDALVRFDDTRMGLAMALLQELAKDRQILLFTCQSRELNWLRTHAQEAVL